MSDQNSAESPKRLPVGQRGNPRGVPPVTFHTLPDLGQLKIRFMGDGDLPYLAEMYHRVAAQQYAHEGWQGTEPLQMLSFLYQTFNSVNLVAELNGKVAGATFGHRKPWAAGLKQLIIDEIFVDPDMQDQSIGTHLLSDQIQIAKVFWNVNALELVTLGDRIHPRNWYEKMGLQVEGKLIVMGGTIEGVKKYLEGRPGGKET